MTTGVLVMAYGTPSGPDDIERYYTDIRGGRAPSPEHLAELAERYAAIGNTFPLARITQEQAEGLGRELGDDFRVFVGNKHASPFVREAVQRMRDEGIEDAVGLVLAPHYSKMSIGGYLERLDKATAGGTPRFRFVESWWQNAGFLDLLVARVSDAAAALTPEETRDDLVLFTAHSLPEKILEWGDPYPDELRGTAQAVAERLHLERFAIAWQSAGRTGEPWIGPPLDEVVAKAAADGHSAVIVCPAGFTADHLEILYDIDIEAQQAAREAGIRLVRTESMNADPAFCRVLADVARGALA